MGIREKIISTVLRTNAISKEVEKAKIESKKEAELNAIRKYTEEIKSLKEQWIKETSNVIEDKLKAVDKRLFVTAPVGMGNKAFNGSELVSGKPYATLYRLFSDAPGSVQCVDRIKDSILGGGYVIEAVKGKEGTKKELKTLIEFFDKVNREGETIEDIISAGVDNFYAYGDWYLEKTKTKNKRSLAEIYSLDSSKMSILVDAEKHKKGVDEKIGYTRLTEASRKIAYSLDDVIHIRRSSSRGGVYGQSIMEKNTATLLLVVNALTYNASIMKNGGVPPIQIILPEDSTETDAEMVSAFYERNFGGPWNAGKPMVTFKGAKAEKIGLAPNDVAYMDLLEYGTRSVAGMYGVPLILIGIPDGTNRSTASSSIKAFYLNKIYPLRKYISNKLTQEIIVNGFGITGWKLDFRSSGLEESDATRRDVMQGFQRGLYTYNEARVKLGLLPLNEDWAEERYLTGSKNDRLIPIDIAIEYGIKNPVEDDSTPDNPDAPDVPNDKEPGEGADELDH